MHFIIKHIDYVTDLYSSSVSNNHHIRCWRTLTPHINNNFDHNNFDLDSNLDCIHSNRIDSSLIGNIHSLHSRFIHFIFH